MNFHQPSQLKTKIPNLAGKTLAAIPENSQKTNRISNEISATSQRVSHSNSLHLRPTMTNVAVFLGFSSLASVDRKIILRRNEKTGVCILPNGDEIYIAPTVLKHISNLFQSYRLDGNGFGDLMVIIDEAGAETKLVPIHRLGVGPTEMSARFLIAVEQTKVSQDGEKIKVSKKLEFTLPISQLEDLGEGCLAAPLWLVIEKLKDKTTSKWGKKFRENNSITGEYVFTSLHSKTSKRVNALKDWLTEQRDQLKEEYELQTKIIEERNIFTQEIANEIFMKLKYNAYSGDRDR